ncbi:MAG: hypothetical protein IH858_05305 [Chloroflexi bacterium]|nr:hypothetical protein [Chloroflexota bacterium]
MTQAEAAFWVGLAIFSPALAKPAWPRAAALLGLSESILDLAQRLAPWLWGIVPAYLALISGAVPARFYGLTGQSPLAWVGGAMLSGVLVGVLTLIRWPQGEWPTPTRGVLDEPRWALYRAAGMLWMPRTELGLLMGLALAVLEWGIRFKPWKATLKEALSTRRTKGAESNWPSGMWETVARIASSSLLFAATRNFWLTALAQAVLLGMARKKNSSVA